MKRIYYRLNHYNYKLGRFPIGFCIFNDGMNNHLIPRQEVGEVIFTYSGDNVSYSDVAFLKAFNLKRFPVNVTSMIDSSSI